MIRAKTKAIFLMILCTLFTSFGQILWKIGVPESGFNVFNIFIFFGFVSYGVSAMLMILSFRFGELSVVYPIIATSYVWVSILSSYYFPEETMNAWKWGGVVLILISVSLLGRKTKAEAVSYG